jgi:hypothetical protein
VTEDSAAAGRMPRSGVAERLSTARVSTTGRRMASGRCLSPALVLDALTGAALGWPMNRSLSLEMCGVDTPASIRVPHLGRIGSEGMLSPHVIALDRGGSVRDRSSKRAGDGRLTP